MLFDRFFKTGKANRVSRAPVSKVDIGSCHIHRERNTEVNEKWDSHKQAAKESRKQEAQEALWW